MTKAGQSVSGRVQLPKSVRGESKGALLSLVRSFAGC